MSRTSSSNTIIRGIVLSVVSTENDAGLYVRKMRKKRSQNEMKKDEALLR